MGKQRPRMGRGNVYTPEKTKTYQEFAAWAAKIAGAIPREGPVAVTIRAYQKFAKVREGEPSTKKADADNIAKMILDSLNGIAWIDDAQVWKLTVEKRYSKDPRVEVHVFYE